MPSYTPINSKANHEAGAFVALERVLPGTLPTVALLVRLQSFYGRLVFHLDPEVGWFRCDQHSEMSEPSALRRYLRGLPAEEAERVEYEVECECLDWLDKMRGRIRRTISRQGTDLFDGG